MPKATCQTGVLVVQRPLQARRAFGSAREHGQHILSFGLGAGQALDHQHHRGVLGHLSVGWQLFGDRGAVHSLAAQAAPGQLERRHTGHLLGTDREPGTA